MDVKIDYLSFTIPTHALSDVAPENAIEYLAATLRAAAHTHLSDWLGSHAFTSRAGGRRYGAALYWQDSHTMLWYGGASNHMLIELPGTACQMLRDEGIFLEVVNAASARVTRLDVAADSVDLGSPKDFVSAGYNERFKSSSQFITETGDTFYVGAMKSERYARVYRYNPPHPRAGITRVEHVLRGDYAKRGADLLLSSGVIELCAAVGQAFGWKSPKWTLGNATDGKLRAQRHDRHGAETLRWIEKAVKPALLRAHRDGLLSLPELFDQILSQLDNQQDNYPQEG